MKIKPLADRVVVKADAAESKTAGGLIIPETAKEKPLQGTVVAAGPGTDEVKMEVKTGDKVLYGRYAGTEVTHEGETYLIMKQNDIFAVLS
jgi:chaperonin GroES